MTVINFGLPRLNGIPKVFDFRRKTYAFHYLKCDTPIGQTSQYIVDVVDTVFNIVLVDEYLVEIDEKRFSVIFGKYDVGGSLKGRKSICSVEGHARILIGS